MQLPDTSVPVTPGQAATTEQQLRAARLQLNDLQINRKLLPDHPDVKAMNRLIADLEAKLDKEQLEAPLSAGGGRAVSTAEAARIRRIEERREQIAQIDALVENWRPAEPGATTP